MSEERMPSEGGQGLVVTKRGSMPSSASFQTVYISRDHHAFFIRVGDRVEFSFTFNSQPACLTVHQPIHLSKVYTLTDIQASIPIQIEIHLNL